jgi:ABC-type transport system substrate-binding protein
MTALFPQIELEIQRPSDGTAFATRQAARDFDAIAYVITVVPDVFLELHSQYHSNGSRNYGSFVEAESDDLIDRGLRSLSLDERIEIADQFQQRFVDDWHPNLIFNIRPERYFLQNNIGGFDRAAGPWAFTVYRLLNDAKHWYFV